MLAAHHARQLPGRQDDVDIRVTTGVIHVGNCTFALFGNAGHDGDDEDLVRVDPQLLGKVALSHRAEHLLGRFRCGQAVHILRELGLDKADPAGAAGGEHGPLVLACVGEALNKLAALLHDRQVSGEVGVKDIVEANLPQGGDHPLDRRKLGAEIKRLGPGCADRGCDLHDSNPVWVLQGVEDGARVVPLDEACGGTVGNALAAVGALRLGDVPVAGDVDGRPGAGSGDVPDVHILDAVADLDAAHTLDALVFVPDQGRVIAPAFAAQLCLVGGVDQVMVVGQLLQGAVSAANAQSAAGVVLGENEPQVCPSRGPDLRTVGVDDHTVLHQIFTCRDEPHVADNLDSADAARADLVDVLEIAEGWNLNFCHAGSFQNRRILRDLDHFVVNRYRYHALFRPPLKLP